MGILEVLQIVFIILKVIGVVTWSWTTVFIPLWICLGLGVLAGIIEAIVINDLK